MPPRLKTSMKYKENRLKSFEEGVKLPGGKRKVYWFDNNDEKIIEPLIECGFYYAPVKSNFSQIICSFCGQPETIEDNLDIKVLLEDHYNKNNNCSLSLIMLSGLENNKKSSKETSFNYWSNHKVNVLKDPLSKESFKFRLNFFNKKYPLDKLRNFKLNSKKLSESGFIYSPFFENDDRVSCYYCNCSLEGWEEYDDPIEEHKKNHNLYCYFLDVYSQKYDGKANAESEIKKLNNDDNIKEDIKRNGKTDHFGRLSEGKEESEGEEDENEPERIEEQKEVKEKETNNMIKDSPIISSNKKPVASVQSESVSAKKTDKDNSEIQNKSSLDATNKNSVKNNSSRSIVYIDDDVALNSNDDEVSFDDLSDFDDKIYSQEQEESSPEPSQPIRRSKRLTKIRAQKDPNDDYWNKLPDRDLYNELMGKKSKSKDNISDSKSESEFEFYDDNLSEEEISETDDASFEPDPPTPPRAINSRLRPAKKQTKNAKEDTDSPDELSPSPSNGSSYSDLITKIEPGASAGISSKSNRKQNKKKIKETIRQAVTDAATESEPVASSYSSPTKQNPAQKESSSIVLSKTPSLSPSQNINDTNDIQKKRSSANELSTGIESDLKSPRKFKKIKLVNKGYSPSPPVYDISDQNLGDYDESNLKFLENNIKPVNIDSLFLKTAKGPALKNDKDIEIDKYQPKSSPIKLNPSNTLTSGLKSKAKSKIIKPLPHSKQSKQKYNILDMSFDDEAFVVSSNKFISIQKRNNEIVPVSTRKKSISEKIPKSTILDNERDQSKVSPPKEQGSSKLDNACIKEDMDKHYSKKNNHPNKRNNFNNDNGHFSIDDSLPSDVSGSTDIESVISQFKKETSSKNYVQIESIKDVASDINKDGSDEEQREVEGAKNDDVRYGAVDELNSISNKEEVEDKFQHNVSRLQRDNDDVESSGVDKGKSVHVSNVQTNPESPTLSDNATQNKGESTITPAISDEKVNQINKNDDDTFDISNSPSIYADYIQDIKEINNEISKSLEIFTNDEDSEGMDEHDNDLKKGEQDSNSNGLSNQDHIGDALDEELLDLANPNANINTSVQLSKDSTNRSIKQIEVDKAVNINYGAEIKSDREKSIQKEEIYKGENHQEQHIIQSSEDNIKETYYLKKDADLTNGGRSSHEDNKELSNYQTSNFKIQDSLPQNGDFINLDKSRHVDSSDNRSSEISLAEGEKLNGEENEIEGSTIDQPNKDINSADNKRSSRILNTETKLNQDISDPDAKDEARKEDDITNVEKSLVKEDSAVAVIRVDEDSNPEIKATDMIYKSKFNGNEVSDQEEKSLAKRDPSNDNVISITDNAIIKSFSKEDKQEIITTRKSKSPNAGITDLSGNFNALLEASTPERREDNPVISRAGKVPSENIDWVPISLSSLAETLHNFEDTANYLKTVATSENDLHNDYDSELTNFISAMPENEEYMTIQEWVKYSASNCGKLVKETCNDIIRVYESDYFRALNVLESLPTED